jgi:hypothetical protein
VERKERKLDKLEEALMKNINAMMILKSDSGILVAVDSQNRLVVSTDKETWEELKLDEAQQKTIAQALFKVM